MTGRGLFEASTEGLGDCGWEWWTRTQRIRTAAEIRFGVPILDTLEPPTYQRIAGKAAHLRELGLSDVVIARRFGVSDKTVAKAIGWMSDAD